jgi:DNA polymerase-3 subunit delta
MKFTNLQAFEKHIESKQFANTYMIIGKDRFACKVAIDKLIAASLDGQNNPAFCLKNFDGDRCSIDSLMVQLHSISFFSEKQLISLDQADKLSKAASKTLEAYFQNPNPSVCFIISASAINHATNFYKFAEKSGVVLEFAEEKPAEKERSMIAWVSTTIASKGKSIEPQASQYLVKQVGTDMSQLYNEIEKLLCYIGDRSLITLNDIGAICCSINLETIWQLGEALFKRDPATSLRITKALLSDGTPLLSLLRQIRHQFQTEYQICSILANGGTSHDITQLFPYMRGFILDRHISSAQSYGMSRFKKGMQLIDETEVSAKNSSWEPDLLAELLIIKLTT